jgi:hypothetical protein
MVVRGFLIDHIVRRHQHAGVRSRPDVRIRDLSAWLFMIAFSISVIASHPCSGADDISLSIHEKTISDFCESIFPLQLKGKKRVSVAVLGRTVSQEMPWTATVSSPSVTISRDEQKFVANVQAESTGLKWKGEVAGTLEARYDAKRQAIVISVSDAVVPITLGPLQIGIDVAKEVPELPFLFSLPEISLPEKGKKVRVVADPTIEFDEGAVVITGDLSFEAVHDK